MEFKRPENLALGCMARHKITELEGVVVCISNWLNGCQRVTIQPKGLTDGKPYEAWTSDAEEFEVEIEAEPQTVKPKGGPSIAPNRAKDPTRF